jgi:hypothetical protein
MPDIRTLNSTEGDTVIAFFGEIVREINLGQSDQGGKEGAQGNLNVSSLIGINGLQNCTLGCVGPEMAPHGEAIHAIALNVNAAPASFPGGKTNLHLLSLRGSQGEEVGAGFGCLDLGGHLI